MIRENSRGEHMPKAWHANVRLGSITDIDAGPHDVRFTPESGHRDSAA
jgi:hypothetical protein